MIKVCKDNTVLEVTKGVYNDILKPLGYDKISDIEDKENKEREDKDYDKISNIDDKISDIDDKKTDSRTSRK